MKKKDEMLEAISRELHLRKSELQYEVSSIYFGGGTPSLLSTEEINDLMNVIIQNYNISKDPEITLEANPDDLSKEKIIALSKTSINRLSIGIQSFYEDDLKMMNRAHTSKEAQLSIEWASKYFTNISIDLIYGIPNMSHEKWRKNLRYCFEKGVQHISSYALTVEPKTALYDFIKKGKYPPIDEKLAAEHFDILLEETSKNDFEQYEISNFAKSNYYSKHNTSYWRSKPYLGIGPSAHSFETSYRSWNISNNNLYIKAIQKGKLPLERETLTKEDKYNEMLMTGLRTKWGISLETVGNLFGLKYKQELIRAAQKNISNGNLEIIENVLLITRKGKFFADGIASELFVVN